MKSRRSAVVLALVACAGAAAVVVAVLPEPQAWEQLLRRVAEAPEQLDYHGTVVLTSFQREPFETRVALEHRAGGRDRFWLEGWRRGDNPWKEASTPRAERKEMRLPHHKRIRRPVLEPALAARNYAVRAWAGESVAGRPASVLNMISVVPGRPSYRLWVDAALGVALGMEVRDAGGNLIHRWKFERFEPGTTGAAPAEPAPPRRRLSLEELKAQKSDPLWLPGSLPAGYAFHAARLRSRAAMLAYTDGMNVISLIQRNPDADGWKLDMERSAQGYPLVHRWSWFGTSVLKVRLGDTSITVVGDEPAESLTGMIRSLTEHR